MQDTIDSAESSGRRYRHRSRTRKAAESIGLVVGVPIVLAVVLALSVELIEYHPVDASIAGDPAQQTAIDSESGVSVRRMPTAVLEIPPMPTQRDLSAR